MTDFTQRFVPAFESKMVGEPFSSKKNRVFELQWEGERCVVKIYSDIFVERAPVEYETLRRCAAAGVPAPKPVALFDGAVIMTLLEGENAYRRFQALYHPNDERADAALEQLLSRCAVWLAQFHHAFHGQYARGDAILKNYLVTDSTIYGCDFEEASRSDPLADLGDMIAFILGMRPKFVPRKFLLARHLAREYWRASGGDRFDALPEAVARSLRFYAQYRTDGVLLQRWARAIAARGLKHDALARALVRSGVDE